MAGRRCGGLLPLVWLVQLELVLLRKMRVKMLWQRL
jgi:hypothetical protein